MQSHRQIAIETLTQTLSGFGVSMLIAYFVIPLVPQWDWTPTFATAWQVTLLYTVSSLGRGYLVRYLFNRR